MKAIINIENYEAFWVDYLDGKLTETDEERLFAFLEDNPEISSNLIDTDNFIVPKLDVVFPDKANLKAENQIENLLISKIENEISEEDNKFITSKINSNAKIAASYSQYQKTILVADTSVVFKGKKHLKKTTVIPLYRYTAAVAAAIAIVFVTGYVLTHSSVELTPAERPQFSFIELPVHVEDSADLNKIEKNIPVNFSVNNNMATNHPTQVEEKIFENNVVIDVPEKMPIANLSVTQNSIDENEYKFIAYRDDMSKENIAFEYTMQYTKSPKDNKFKSAVNKIYKIGKEIDVQESWNKVKIAKEEFLSFN